MGHCSKRRQSRTSEGFLLAAALLAAFAAGLAQAETGRLEFADKLRMVSCEPASSVPCFRLKLNMVDDQGRPISPVIPDAQSLRKSIRVQADGLDVKPFFAIATK